MNNKMIEITTGQNEAAKKLREQIDVWAKTTHQGIREAVAGIVSSAPGPAAGPAATKEATVDKKEVVIWKLPPKVDKDEFRYWWTRCTPTWSRFIAFRSRRYCWM